MALTNYNYGSALCNDETCYIKISYRNKAKSNLHCPNCNSENVMKNGHILGGKQNHLCKDCGRQFGFIQLRFVDFWA